jgi:hypothetical protein
VLSLRHPEIMQFLSTAGPGLWPIRLEGKELALTIKSSVDLAFAAKHRGAFKFHFYDVQVGSEKAVGVITAFYDRSNAPLVIQTVCSDAVMRNTMIELVQCETLNVYFFDAHDSEVFGGEWRLSKQNGIMGLFETCKSDLKKEVMLDFYVALKQRFSNPNDDGLVINAALIATTLPNNLSVIHVTEEAVRSARGEGHGIYASSLDSIDRPGDSHEAEIARLMAKIYPPEKVVVGPEIEKGKEFCDVLAIGKYEAIAIQAKSTVRDVRRFDEPEAKRDGRLDKHFRKAVAQAKGADRAFYKLRKEVKFRDGTLGLTPLSKLLVHVIVVHEKAPSLLEDWSREIVGFASETTPVVVLDTAEFVNLLSTNKDRDSFLGAIMALADIFEREKKIGAYDFRKGRIASATS